MPDDIIHLMFRSDYYVILALGAMVMLFSAEAVRAQTASTSTTASTNTSHQTLFPGLTGNELVDSLRVHFRPAVLTSSYTEARDVLFGEIQLDDTGTLTCVYTGDRLTWDAESGLTVRMYAQENGWNTEHIWPQSMGAGSGNARIDMHHLRPVRADVNSSRSNYAFAFLEPEEVTRWWRGDVSQTDTPSGDLGEWSRTRSTSPARFEARDPGKGDVARAMFYFYTMYPAEAREVNPQYLYLQMDDLRSYHNIDPVDTDELGWTWAIAEYQDGRPNPFVVDTTLIRRAYFEDYEPWDPSDVELDDPDAFLVEYTFAGTVSCDEENPWPLVPEGRVDATAMQRTGVVCNQGTGTFNSRLWPVEPDRSPDHYISFTITAGERPIDLSGGADVAYQIRRSGTGPDQFVWRVRIDGGDWMELDAGTLGGTGDFTREVELAVPEGAGGGAGGGDGVLSGSTSSAQSTQSLTPAESVQSIEFRMYGWNASSGGGTLRLNYITVDGLLSDPSETLGVTVPGEYPGWRLMSMPVAGVRLADLAAQNQIQGIDGVGELYAGEHPGIEFEHGQAPNVLWYGAGYGSGAGSGGGAGTGTGGTGSGSGSGNGSGNADVGGVGSCVSGGSDASGTGWIVPEDIFSSIAPGTGLAWYFFHNDVGPSRSLPFDLQVTGVPFGADVEAPLSTGWNLMGNPFTGAIALDDIIYLDAAGTELAPVGAVQVWDPGSQSWVILGPGEPLAAWHGFFVEDNGADALRFRIGGVSGGGLSLHTWEQGQHNEKPEAGRVAGEGSPFGLRFSLFGEDADDGHRTADHALSLIIHPDAGPGYDRFDMRKIPPLTPRYAQAVFLGAKLPDSDSDIPKAQESRNVDEGSFTLPLDVHASGMSGTFTLAWSGMDAVPVGRRITLVDNKTGAQIDLRETAYYEFEWVDASGGGATAGAADYGAAAQGDAPQGDSRFTLQVTADTDTRSNPDPELPERFALQQNYPNPFNPATVISYALPEQAQVRLAIYDMLGRTVAVLVDGQQAPGRYDVTWDASSHSSGVYIYRIDTGGLTITRKMTLIK